MWEGFQNFKKDINAANSLYKDPTSGKLDEPKMKQE
jgi:hypothetical protein